MPLPFSLDPGRCRPPRSLDLLLKASLLPHEAAGAAWRTWLAENDFEAVSWSELRLLASLSGRLGSIAPDSPLRPRVDGLARIQWTRTQAKLRSLAETADLFATHAVPALVFKGAAGHLEGLEQLRRRVPGDADVLVRAADFLRAQELLLAAGWQDVNGESPEYIRATEKTRAGRNFRRGAHAEIDVHQAVLHVCRRDAAFEDGLWARARTVISGGRTYTVPSPADSVFIGLAHGALSSGGDWALDAAARISAGGIDWHVLVAVTRASGLIPQARSGLLYLRDSLGQAVPDAVLADLAGTPGSLGMRIMNAWSRHGGDDRPLAGNVIRFLGVRRLLGDDYRRQRPKMTAEVRAHPAWRHGTGRSVLAAPTSEITTAREVQLSATLKPGARLRVALTVEAQEDVGRRALFDVSAGGIAFARLRARLRKRGAQRLVFTVPLLPHSAADRIKIEARPSAYLPPAASARDTARFAPVPFRIDVLALI